MRKHPILRDIRTVKPYQVTAGHLLYEVRPPVMQIEDFLPASGIMGITSYPGVGKTWLALEVCRAVASGTPFLGKYAARRGGVLFVGSDSSLYDYAIQWTRLTRRTKNAVEVFEPVQFLLQSDFMFEDEEAVRRLIRTHQTFKWGEVTHEPGTNLPLQERGFHTIVFDTVSKLTRAKQNDNTEMEEVFRNIRLIAEITDAALVLLHHNSKRTEFNDGTDWRGALSQIGALDSWVHISPHKKDKYLIGVEYKKFRGITPAAFAYRMHVLDRSEATLTATDEPVTVEQQMQADPLAEAIVAHAREHPGLRACEIREALWPTFSAGVEDGTGKLLMWDTTQKMTRAVNNRINALLHAGRLHRDQSEEGKSIYRVTGPKPDEAGPTA